jgi:hypothetical protein
LQKPSFLGKRNASPTRISSPFEGFFMDAVAMAMGKQQQRKRHGQNNPIPNPSR